MNIFEVCTLKFKHYSEAADMENKKDKVALNDELLDKVSGGGVRHPDYEPDGSFFCQCENPVRDSYGSAFCVICGKLLNH